MNKCIKNNCSDCCKDIYLPLGIDLDDDAERWIKYHNIELVKKDEVICIKINNTCSKLIDDKCSVYDDRPYICKLFNCDKYE